MPSATCRMGHRAPVWLSLSFIISICGVFCNGICKIYVMVIPVTLYPRKKLIFSVGAVPIDPRLQAPWVASIFKKNSANNQWEYICGGTITSANTVITS